MGTRSVYLDPVQWSTSRSFFHGNLFSGFCVILLTNKQLLNKWSKCHSLFLGLMGTWQFSGCQGNYSTYDLTPVFQLNCPVTRTLLTHIIAND